MEAQYHPQEKKRIETLHQLGVLDTPPEERFDRITNLASILFDVPIALVSLVDANRQWFKSCYGLSTSETPRSMSFCAHAILGEDVLVIEDATKDSRFANNPLVTGEPHIRFYAGKPIRAENNLELGTLCIIDKEPRKFSKSDKKLLSDLGNWVEGEFKNITLTNSLISKTKKLELAEKILSEKNINLENEISTLTSQLLNNQRISIIGTLASRLAHDLKNPLSVLKMYVELMKTPRDKEELAKKYADALEKSIQQMSRIIEDTLDFVKTTTIHKSECSINSILSSSVMSLDIPEGISVNLPKNDLTIMCDPDKLEAVFSNLILNSVQALGKSGKIDVLLEQNSHVKLKFIDSGPGIPENVLPRIFDHLYTTKETGTGLGLGICQTVIKLHGGTISVSNNPTTFTIELPKQ